MAFQTESWVSEVTLRPPPYPLRLGSKEGLKSGSKGGVFDLNLRGVVNPDLRGVLESSLRGPQTI